MLYIEASAKRGDGVAQTFEELLQKILDVPSLCDPGGGSGGAGGGSKLRVGAGEYADDDGGDQACC
jgi:hypothetical protein